MTALDRWAAAGLVEVPLPSGFRVKVCPVSPTTLILLDLAPSLVGEVLDAKVAGTPDEAIELKAGETAFDIALRAVRSLWDEESQTWEPVALTAALVASAGFNPDDIDAIMEAALAKLNETAEGPVSLDDLRPFRDERAGDAAGEDGGAVAPAAVLPRRARRSAARAGARRGAGAPAVAG